MEARNTEITKAEQTAAALTAHSGELINRFVGYIDRTPRTTKTYLTNLRQFFAWLIEQGVENPTRADIIAYRDYIAKTYKPNTASQYLRSVKQLFAWTASEGLYPNVASNVHAPKVAGGIHRKEALNVEEVNDIERSLSEDRTTEKGKRLYAMYLLAVNAGLRTIELSRANVKDLVKKAGQTRLYVWGKGHSEPDQVKALSPAVAEAIEDYLKSRTDKLTAGSPLFVATGNRSHGKRIASNTISTMLKTAMVNAGYDSERLTAHSLRHTAGTAVMNMTGNLYETQQYMRHCNPATTEIYLHTEREQADAVTASRLWNYYHGTEDRTPRERLNALMDKLTDGQIEDLIAQAERALEATRQAG